VRWCIDLAAPHKALKPSSCSSRALTLGQIGPSVRKLAGSEVAVVGCKHVRKRDRGFRRIGECFVREPLDCGWRFDEYVVAF
jgi:hypothetical protein